MKRQPQKLVPRKIAISATIVAAITSFLTTILAIINPAIKTITPLLESLYGMFGYTITFTGALIGTLYIAIDTFILVYLFAWIYNKIL
jgi:phage-related protein